MEAEITDRYKETILRCFELGENYKIIKVKPVSKHDSGPLGNASERLRKDGYKDLRVLDKKFLSHRIVWLLLTKNWPTHEIDHIDFNRSNNHPSNLRELTPQQNRYRNSVVGSGKSKFIGVKQDKKGFWIAKVGQRYLGYFRDELDAARAYNKGAIEDFGDLAKVNDVS